MPARGREVAGRRAMQVGRDRDRGRMRGAKMMMATETARPAPSAVGEPIRLELLDGGVMEGITVRWDERTVRLRAAGRPGVLIVYRSAVARVA